MQSDPHYEAIIDPVTEIPFTEFTRQFFHWRWCACLIALARYLTRCGALLARCGALLARCGAATSSLRSATNACRNGVDARASMRWRASFDSDMSYFSRRLAQMRVGAHARPALFDFSLAGREVEAFGKGNLLAS